jgi:hypothetical protein
MGTRPSKGPLLGGDLGSVQRATAASNLRKQRPIGGRDMTKTQRLKEYGMYIRINKQGTYNLGFTFSQRPGGVGTFPTYDDAYEAFEHLVELFWEYKGDEFLMHAEDMIFNHYKRIKTPEDATLQQQREAEKEEAREKLYELTKF